PEDKRLKLKHVEITGEGKNRTVKIGGILVEATKVTEREKIADYMRSVKSIATIREEAKKGVGRSERIAASDLTLLEGRLKPGGRLRTWPWFEERGPNPYLLVTGHVHTNAVALLNDELPVVLEPLIKFMHPIIYFLDPRAGFWERLYLIFAILW